MLLHDSRWKFAPLFENWLRTTELEDSLRRSKKLWITFRSFPSMLLQQKITLTGAWLVDVTLLCISLYYSNCFSGISTRRPVSRGYLTANALRLQVECILVIWGLSSWTFVSSFRTFKWRKICVDRWNEFLPRPWLEGCVSSAMAGRVDMSWQASDRKKEKS